MTGKQMIQYTLLSLACANLWYLPSEFDILFVRLLTNRMFAKWLTPCEASDLLFSIAYVFFLLRTFRKNIFSILHPFKCNDCNVFSIFLQSLGWHSESSRRTWESFSLNILAMQRRMMRSVLVSVVSHDGN